MAVEAKDGSQEFESSGSNKKNSNIALTIIVVLLLLVLAIGGVVAYFMLSGDKGRGNQSAMQQAHVGQGTTQHTMSRSGVGPMYPLDKFTVNLMSENGHRYLVVKMNLEESHEGLTTELDQKLPLVRDIIISVLSSKTVDEISTSKGKEKLKQEIINQLNKYLENGEVRYIYFTEFMIQ